MQYKTYGEYLRHPRFREIRMEAMIAANNTCLDCGKKPATEVHHIKYPPWGTFDVVENLIPLCHGCHCLRHGKDR